MEIKFKNGNTIEVIDSNEGIRSKRGEEYIKQMCEYYENNLWMFMEDMGIKLYWYQKAYLKFNCFFNKRLLKGRMK